jgi:hypothetical protein
MRPVGSSTWQALWFSSPAASWIGSISGANLQLRLTADSGGAVFVESIVVLWPTHARDVAEIIEDEVCGFTNGNVAWGRGINFANPTSGPPSCGLDMMPQPVAVGAIVGAVVGSVIFAAFVVVAVFFVIRRRRHVRLTAGGSNQHLTEQLVVASDD